MGAEPSFYFKQVLSSEYDLWNNILIIQGNSRKIGENWKGEVLHSESGRDYVLIK